ncbi:MULTISPECIES: heavy-metal-associated domain-containing protein [Alcaligenaceae]|uniref:Copper chaperone CopZ n=1 Tax=Paracandidimonas soli TaxID=1917182 RepID=A0A4R3VAD2_9BURK|nr:heavy-metal-associated domain-containing protein [Paracandidimonas soli]NYT24470.1 cation transporter [Alcaligenaceae bacterium]TCV00439.1 copper chaperone CopZ [Paracandidimonas soli]
MKQIELKVAGMTCGACVARVTRALVGVPGVHNAEVDLARGVARANVNDVAAIQPALLQALAAAGYPAQQVTGSAVSMEGSQEAAPEGSKRDPRASGGCCGGH